MKVALIGASGFIGSRLLAELSARGHAVTAIVRNPEKVAALAGVTAVKFTATGFVSLTVAGGMGVEGLPVLRFTVEDTGVGFDAAARDRLFTRFEQADGPRTGKYVLAGEEFTANEAGESAISYADYAIAIVDEATAAPENAHINERISVRW